MGGMMCLAVTLAVYAGAFVHELSGGAVKTSMAQNEDVFAPGCTSEL